MSNKLSRTQVDIVQALRKNYGRIVSYETLADLAWPLLPGQDADAPLPRTWKLMLSQMMCGIRKNFPSFGKSVVTVHEKGYMLTRKKQA